MVVPRKRLGPYEDAYIHKYSRYTRGPLARGLSSAPPPSLSLSSWPRIRDECTRMKHVSQRLSNRDLCTSSRDHRRTTFRPPLLHFSSTRLREIKGGKKWSTEGSIRFIQGSSDRILHALSLPIGWLTANRSIRHDSASVF